VERISNAVERARQRAESRHEPVWTPRGMDVRPGYQAPPDPPPAAGLLPLDAAHLEQHRIVALQEATPTLHAFELLRTQVLHKMQEHGWRTVAVTSPSRQAGKTVVAINLALCIARHPSWNALLLDFDLRRPQVASCLGLPAADSLNEVLAGRADVHSVIVQAGIRGFHVLPTQRRLPAAAAGVATDGLGRVIDALRHGQAHRIIVIDMPPVHDVLDVLPWVDCVLLVMGNAGSTKPEIEQSKRHLARCPLLGVVVNKAPSQH
jgi:protein-tyrosine kinase